jgi:hypothetical protein
MPMPRLLRLRLAGSLLVLTLVLIAPPAAESFMTQFLYSVPSIASFEFDVGQDPQWSFTVGGVTYTGVFDQATFKGRFGMTFKDREEISRNGVVRARTTLTGRISQDCEIVRITLHDRVDDLQVTLEYPLVGIPFSRSCTASQ